MSVALRPRQLSSGTQEAFQSGFDALQTQCVDDVWKAPVGWQPPAFARTISQPAEVSGPGTYDGRATRALRFLPTTAKDADGWHFNRTDLPEQLPITAMLANVSQADRAIILRAGSNANRVRMTEHIVCHRLGLGIDNLKIELASEDPPLFDVGSMPIVEALSQAGIVEDTNRPLRYVTPAEPVVLMHPNNGGFLLWEPAENGEKKLSLDVAIDFQTAIGKERIQLDLYEDAFRHGAVARTNCSASERKKMKFLGWMVADFRHTGYTSSNILVAGRDGYVNDPRLVLGNGKALEAVWHRTCLDLIAALSLLPPGTRPAGKITSYKSGHVLDVRFLTILQAQGLLSVVA